MLILAALSVTAVACGSTGGLPQPRPLIIHSGARLRPEPERMAAIDRWVTEELTNIREDPTFLIVSVPQDQPALPWQGLEINADTARVAFERTSSDVQSVYQIYAHLHLMVTMDRQAEWLPEAPDATGYQLERAILKRVSDAWLYGRATWAFVPDDIMDELTYATEEGFLDAYILTARGDDFEAERADWTAQNAGQLDEYRAWFERTFDRLPPGLREEAEEAGRDTGPGGAPTAAT